MEPFESGQVDAFTVYPCVGITDAPCDSANDIRVRAVDGFGHRFGAGAAVFQVDPLRARIYNGHMNSGVLQSVNDGDTVSWQTAVAASGDGLYDDSDENVVRHGVQLAYSRSPFGGHEDDWKRPQYGISARDVDGNTPPPGKVFFRSTSSGNELRKAESPDYEEVPTSLSDNAVTAIKFDRFLEFEKLGTYKITWHVAAKRSTAHGSEDCLPDSSNVNQAFCATETYTFHVGPMADLGVEDGGVSPYVATGRNALTVVAVNNGPDEPSGGAQVTGLPTGEEVIHISHGIYNGSTGVWNIAELKVKDYYRSAGETEPTLVLGASAGDTASVSIASAENHEVCVGPMSNPVDLPHTTQAACEAVANASWNSTPVYDYKPGNNTATITARGGSVEPPEGQPVVKTMGDPESIIAVMWEPVESVNGLAVSHYEVQKAQSPWETVAEVTGTQYVDTNPGKNPRYRVRAVNGPGVAGPWSTDLGIALQSDVTQLTLAEGESAGYQVWLDARPLGDVEVRPSSNNPDVTVSPGSLTFTRDNYDQPQTFTVQARRDNDGVDDTATITHNTGGVAGPLSIRVNVTETDAPGVSVSPSTLNVPKGKSGQYIVSLNTQPTGDVTIDIDVSSNTANVTYAPQSLTFTPDNWYASQTVTVSVPQGAPDAATATITHAVDAAASADEYDGLGIPSVTVLVLSEDPKSVSERIVLLSPMLGAGGYWDPPPNRGNRVRFMKYSGNYIPSVKVYMERYIPTTRNYQLMLADDAPCSTATVTVEVEPSDSGISLGHGTDRNRETSMLVKVGKWKDNGWAHMRIMANQSVKAAAGTNPEVATVRHTKVECGNSTVPEDFLPPEIKVIMKGGGPESSPGGASGAGGARGEASVEPANRPPSFAANTDTTLELAENSAGGVNVGSPIAADDPDGDTLTYSLSGTDPGSFAIDANGQLTTIEGVTYDYEGKPSYSLTVDASDGRGGTASIALTVNLANVNEQPAFAGPSATREVAENSPAGTTVGEPVAATDPDAGDTLSYSLAGDDANAFDINSGTGQLLTIDGLSYDYETKPSYSLRVQALDGGGLVAGIDVTVNLKDVAEGGASGQGQAGPEPNRAPAFAADTDTSLDVDENTAGGVKVGSPIAADDPDGDKLTYSLSGNDAASFDIDSATGQLVTKQGVTYDYETKDIYSLKVTATDPDGASASIDVTVSLNDVEESEPNRAPAFAADTDTSLDVDENTAGGVKVGSPITADDPDGDKLTYSRSGNDAASFDIDSATGQLVTKQGVTYDYETKSSYSLKVTATDPDGASTSIDVTVSLNDVAEATPVTECFTQLGTLSNKVKYAGAWDDADCKAHHQDSRGRYFHFTLSEDATVEINLSAGSLYVSKDTPKNGWGTEPGGGYEHRRNVRRHNGKLVHDGPHEATVENHGNTVALDLIAGDPTVGWRPWAVPCPC